MEREDFANSPECKSEPEKEEEYESAEESAKPDEIDPEKGKGETEKGDERPEDDLSTPDSEQEEHDGAKNWPQMPLTFVANSLLLRTIRLYAFWLLVGPYIITKFL